MLDSEFDTATIKLKVTDWVQAINSGSNMRPAGMVLRANCVAVRQPGHALELTNDHRLHDIPIHLSTFPHEGPVVRCNGQPLERGIGLCNYDNSKSKAPSINCCFALSPEHYQETWRQVGTGAFNECSILIDVAPLLHKSYASVWEIEKTKCLFLLGATIIFKRALAVVQAQAAGQPLRAAPQG